MTQLSGEQLSWFILNTSSPFISSWGTVTSTSPSGNLTIGRSEGKKPPPSASLTFELFIWSAEMMDDAQATNFYPIIHLDWFNIMNYSVINLGKHALHKWQKMSQKLIPLIFWRKKPNSGNFLIYFTTWPSKVVWSFLIKILGGKNVSLQCIGHRNVSNSVIEEFYNRSSQWDLYLVPLKTTTMDSFMKKSRPFKVIFS